MEDFHSYNAGYEDGRAQAQADKESNKLLQTLFLLALRIMSIFIMLAPALFISYMISEKLRPLTGTFSGWQKFALLLALAYLTEMLFFFIKGWMMSLKERANKLWILLLSVCLIYSLLFPIFMFKILTITMFGRPGQAVSETLTIASWVVGILAGLFIFSRYRLQQDCAPFIWRWAYNIGRGL